MRLLMKLLTVTVPLAVLLLCVGLPGLYFLTMPLRPNAPPPPWYWVASINELPKDGTPKLCSITRRQRNAWQWVSDDVLGYVFVRRLEKANGVAVLWNYHVHYFEVARTPYRGFCRVAYNKQTKTFQEVGGSNNFDLEGQMIQANPFSFSRLPPAQHKVKNGQVYVRYQTQDEVAYSEAIAVFGK